MMKCDVKKWDEKSRSSAEEKREKGSFGGEAWQRCRQKIKGLLQCKTDRRACRVSGDAMHRTAAIADVSADEPKRARMCGAKARQRFVQAIGRRPTRSKEMVAT